LGVVLYEMATGRRPFSGDTPADLVASILKDTPAPITDLHPGYPHHFARIVKHCLEKEPERRPRSAADLRNELASLTDAGEEEAPAPGPSIAVLPFADMSREKDQEYFCEGIAEEIINALTRVKGLQVASRTSSFGLKGTPLGSRDIGRKLRVRHLLEGSVRKSGDRLRITVEMTDVEGGFHLWSERFDRQMEDIFAIQDEIAANVARNLELSLGPGAQRAMHKAQPSDIQAYDFYLRGRRYFYQYRRKGMEYALQMFSRAIEIDPRYALAYAGIADCSCYLYMYDVRSEENRARVESASRKALELDPDLAQAHASRGMALSLQGRHGEAEQAFELAIRLDPQLFEAHYFYARDAFAQGKLDKSLQEYERASAVRPEDYQCPLLSAQIYTSLGREAEAMASRRRGLRLAEDRLKTHPHEVRALYLGASALVGIGERDLGLQWANRALQMEPDDSMLLYNVGCIKSLAGRIDEAIDCLEKANRAGLTQREWYANDSDLDPVRRHPRFLALMESMEKAP
ncbi:MAG TPA: tetratricopeptide repeat protein, partial [Candidatus Polarisedimenticolia bacterium]|nr:tetratricopeptide repeat protein [Candidatus Polarisedimenticolia bacterium]